MARFVFKLPDVGEGVAESEIAAWRVEIGDPIAEDQPLVDMLTDKAAVEIPSPVAGVLIEKFGQAGDKIAVGAPLLVIETGDAAAVETSTAMSAGPAPPPTPMAPTRIEDKPQTSPALRKRARELAIDLDHVPGTGPRGRITSEDLDAYVAGAPPGAPADTDAVEAVKLIGVRRKIAEAMQRSTQRIPHFSYVEEVDVTELEALRQHLNALHGEQRGKLTFLSFLVHALVKVRARFPQINATFDDEAGVIYRHTASHIGIATQTPNGLIVPVVRNAERLDIWAAAAEIRRLAEAARAGKARREELSGSSITISSLGPLGGIVSTPIINAPEVAIVGINKMVERPMIRNGVVAPRLMMNLSSSFDHRIVDGWDAAAFIQEVRKLLENPAMLFLA